MGFFQPPTGDDQIATGFTQGFLHLMRCLFVEGTHPGQPDGINGGVVLPQGWWMDSLLAFRDEDHGFIQNAQMAQRGLQTNEILSPVHSRSGENRGEEFINLKDGLSRKRFCVGRSIDQHGQGADAAKALFFLPMLRVAQGSQWRMQFVRFGADPLRAKNGIGHLNIWGSFSGIQKASKQIGKRQHTKPHALIAVVSSRGGLDHLAPSLG